MALVEDDDVVEQLPAHAADPPFGDAVLPRTSPSRPHRIDAERPHGRDNESGEDGVAIENQMACRRVEGECLPQLLNDPRRGGIVCQLEVKDAAPAVLDCEPAVEQTKRDCWDDEEVHR